MLNTIDHRGKIAPTYKCDRCGAVTLKEKRKGIYVTGKSGNPSKKWDLCLRCYKSLELGIAKGVKTKDGKTTSN